MTKPTPLTLAPLALALAALGACAPKAPPPPAPLTLEVADAAAVQAITNGALDRRIRALADDAMEGRGPGSEGDVKARAWLVAELQQLGYEPAGLNGSWEQPFAMVGINASMPDTWEFKGPQGSLALARHDDFIAGSGVQRDRATISNAEIVFVGYGIEAPEYQWDDFKGVDVKGKVLLMLNNDPDWDPTLFAGERRLWYGRWDYKYLQAAKHGAVGAIIIHTVPSAGYPFQVVQTSWSGEQFAVPAGDEARIEVSAWTTEDAAKKLVALAGQDLDALRTAARERTFEPTPLGITTSFDMPVAIRSVETANVLALLPGSDPQKAREVVLYSAHHDHLGRGRADADGDDIYNGAVDNASGVAQLLAVADAFTKLPRRPARSILFNFVGAEEQGLLGSKYWASNPTVAPGLVAANLNADGGNIWGKTRDVTSVGWGKSPDLDALLVRLAERQGRRVEPDQFPDRGSFYRSDQFAFARIGIPSIYLKTGTDFIDRPEGWGREQIEAWEATQYHQPSDEVGDGWVLDGMVAEAKLFFEAGVEIAEGAGMPTWAVGDEFEAARKANLAAVPPAPAAAP